MTVMIQQEYIAKQTETIKFDKVEWEDSKEEEGGQGNKGSLETTKVNNKCPDIKGMRGKK